MRAKMFREFQERDILFTNAIDHTDGAVLAARQPDDVAAGRSKLALHRPCLVQRRRKMLLKEFSENIHSSERYHHAGKIGARVQVITDILARIAACHDAASLPPVRSLYATGNRRAGPLSPARYRE